MAVGLKKAIPFRNGSPLQFSLRGKRYHDRKRQDKARSELKSQIGKLGADLTDPYTDITNTFGGLANPFADQENPFADLTAPKFQTEFENKFEDLGVNTKAAEFAQQQFQQNQAAQLQSMKEAGISGSQVQAMANASLQQAATTRADIGGQEQQNKAMAAQGAEGVQRLEASAKKDQAMASFETDKLVRQGQFDVDKLIGSTQLDVDKTVMEGDWKTQMAQAKGASELQNLQLQADQAQLSLQAGLIEGKSAEMASKKWWQSDRKLKYNIVLVGKSPSGLSIYNFEYKNSKFGKGIWQGVMSDEIPSDAVMQHADGYDMVDYSKIDVNFVKIKN
jgi:hypothetical protein